MPEKEGAADAAMDKIGQIRKAVGDFRNAVASHVKDTEIKDWRFGVETHEEGVTIDVSVKLLIKPKESARKK